MKKEKKQHSMCKSILDHFIIRHNINPLFEEEKNSEAPQSVTSRAALIDKNDKQGIARSTYLDFAGFLVLFIPQPPPDPHPTHSGLPCLKGKYNHSI
jgi:hypothetical protein